MVVSNLDMTTNKNISNSEVDIISNLHDNVLSYILRFLPTIKEVVATSTLSKRWRYVWKIVDTLVFEVGTNKSVEPFVYYDVLKLHQGSIKEFRLCCYSNDGNHVDVTSWINSAVSRGVEKVVVSSKSWQCPVSIYTCKTLVDLRIPELNIKKSNLPNAPIFPSLRKLHIGSRITNDDDSFEDIVSKCLALEHLIVYTDKTRFEIESSSIKRLELHSTCEEKIRLKIRLVSVPSLEYLLVECHLPSEFFVEDKLSSLVEVDIIVRSLYYSLDPNAEPPSDCFPRFIQLFSNVKVIRLKSPCWLTSFNSVGHERFLNLTKLEIAFPYLEWTLLVRFMESSINLEEITLRKIYDSKTLEWEEPKDVPVCVSSSLRKLSIFGYCDNDLPLVKYFLGIAQFLERVHIHREQDYKDERKLVTLHDLQKLHRASQGCEISVV